MHAFRIAMVVAERPPQGITTLKAKTAPPATIVEKITHRQNRLRFFETSTISIKYRRDEIVAEERVKAAQTLTRDGSGRNGQGMTGNAAARRLVDFANRIYAAVPALRD